MKWLVLVALPVFAESSGESLAREMVLQAKSAPWGQVYEKRPGCSVRLAGPNTPTHAIALWSYACLSTLRGVQRTEYYYATPLGTVTLQYLHLSLSSITDQTEEIFESLRARLRRNFGEPIHPYGLLYTGAWNWPPDQAGERWSSHPSELILHRRPHKPEYGEMLAGPQLAVIERARFELTNDDEELGREIGPQTYMHARNSEKTRSAESFPNSHRGSTHTVTHPSQRCVRPSSFLSRQKTPSRTGEGCCLSPQIGL